jgi:colicin import membrane protein
VNSDYDENFARAGLPDPRSQKETEVSEQTNLVALTIKRPDEALFKSSEIMLETARSWKITTGDGALAAGEDLKAIKTLAKQVEDKRTAITGPINDALREVNALFKPAKDWLAQAEKLLKGKLLDYQSEQTRIAREAQAKADEEARKQREKLEQQAVKAEAKGKAEKAEELREQAELREAPVVSSAAPKIEGVSTREIWKAEVTDKLAFLKHVVEKRPDLAALVQLDQGGLNAQARSLKDALDLPGVKAVKESIIAARGH